MGKTWNNYLQHHCLVLWCCVVHWVVAQDENPVLEQALANGSYDPIAATLDSLVNLNYIARLNGSASGTESVSNFQPSDSVMRMIFTVSAWEKSRLRFHLLQQSGSGIHQHARCVKLTERWWVWRICISRSTNKFLINKDCLWNLVPQHSRECFESDSSIESRSDRLWQFMLSTGKL